MPSGRGSAGLLVADFVPYGPIVGACEPMIIATVGANMSDQKSKAAVELQSFKDAELWKGGFLDCDPINPLMWSSYTTNGFVSIYHAIYWAAIKPYMPQAARVLEIGPGHGAWTRALIHGGAAKVIGLDVQAREFNGIDMWLGEDASKLDYYVVEDMTCSMVEDDSIDFGPAAHLYTCRNILFRSMSPACTRKCGKARTVLSNTPTLMFTTTSSPTKRV